MFSFICLLHLFFEEMVSNEAWNMLNLKSPQSSLEECVGALTAPVFLSLCCKSLTYLECSIFFFFWVGAIIWRKVKPVPFCKTWLEPSFQWLQKHSVYSMFDSGCKLLLVGTALWITLLKITRETFQTFGKRDEMVLKLLFLGGFCQPQCCITAGSFCEAENSQVSEFLKMQFRPNFCSTWGWFEVDSFTHGSST